MNEIPPLEQSIAGQIGEEYEPADLVVDLPHLDLVQDVLCNTLHVWPALPRDDQIRRSEALGLALLAGLQNMTGRGERLPRAAGNESSFTDLDAVLNELRTELAKRYGGWTPALGKNRHIGKPVTVDDTEARIGILWPLGGCGGRSCPMADPITTPMPAMPGTVPPVTEGPAGSGVRVGILDTAPYPHPRLFGHIPDSDFRAALVDRQEHGKVWLPWEGHATFVADLVLRQAPSAELIMRTVLGGDNGRANLWDVANHIVGFNSTGIDILNLALGGRTADGQPPLLLVRAVERLGRDVLVVAAAGNHGATAGGCNPVWPAAMADVIAVGASDMPESPKLPWVTCTANGNEVAAYLSETVLVPTTLPPRFEPFVAGARPSDDERERLHVGSGARESRTFHGYASWSGTSFSAATVSGAAAAAMTRGRTARAALDALLEQPNGVVKRYVHQP